MVKSVNTVSILLLSALLSVMLISCGGGGSGSSSVSESATGTGTLVLKLTDASTEVYRAIYVTIAEVQTHKAVDAEDDDAGWQTILTPEKTYNLLELVNGVFETLGVAELAAGKYNQMRLILDDQPDGAENILGESHPFANYLIDGEDEYKELKVPSGFQTGIKIVKGFTIVNTHATELILDFDASRSVVQAGKNGKYLLKPTIKVLETVENSVSGRVDDGVDPIGGALVSGQVYDPGAADPRDEVTVESTTVSTEEGRYKLYLPPGVYNIVVTKDGYLPNCQVVDAQFFEDYTADFSLDAVTAFITLSGTVSGLASEEDSALVSIRQTIDCGAGDTVIEVASGSVAEGGDYAFTLPAGTYELVASAPGVTTQVFEDISADLEQDIGFDL